MKLFRIYTTPLAFIAGLLSFAVGAHAAPCDFNADGLSDASSVRILSNGKLNWKIAANGQSEKIATRFGALGVHLAAGDYLNEGKSRPAYIDADGVWHVWGDRTQSFEHGEPKATYMAGADIDGDNKADALFYTNTCTKKDAVLHAVSDPLGAPVSYSLVGGAGNQFTTYGDANGDGADDLCYAEPITQARGKLSQRFQIICKDIRTGNRVARFAVGRLFGRPLPITSDDGSPVRFALPRVKKGKTLVNVVNVNGKSVQKKIVFNSTETLLVGNYTSTTGLQQLAMANGDNLLVYDLNNRTYANIPAPTGILFDQININHFESTLDDCECTATDIARNKSCPAGGSRCQVSRSLSDGLNGWLHKPVSESTHSMVNLLPPGEIASGCSYEQRNGQKIKDAYSSGIANGNRQHWRPVGGGHCSGFPSNTVFTCTIKGKRNCWTLPDPCRRYD